MKHIYKKTLVFLLTGFFATLASSAFAGQGRFDNKFDNKMGDLYDPADDILIEEEFENLDLPLSMQYKNKQKPLLRNTTAKALPGKSRAAKSQSAKSQYKSQPQYYAAGLAELNNIIKTFFPNERVGLKRINKSIAVSGIVTDAEVANRIIEIAEQYVNRGSDRSQMEFTNVVNMMQVRTSQQVMLNVRVGEITRSALKNYGLAGFASLEKDGLVKVLAEPNLVAISGETANFLAGGQIPVPVQGAGGTTVEYKNVGVGLEFTPFVLSENRIRLTVESEVSELSDSGGLASANLTMPAIESRKAKTTVELSSGESFMIAGLIKDNVNINNGGATPLSAIPIIGSILGGSEFARDETELVISVTPYLVDPVKSDDVKMPTDQYLPPSNLELIFMGALGSMSGKDNVQTLLPGGGSPLEGTFGFMTE